MLIVNIDYLGELKLTDQKHNKFYQSWCLLLMFGFSFSLANCLWMSALELENIPYNTTIGIFVSLILWIIFGNKLSNRLYEICDKLESKIKGDSKN